MRSSTTRKRPAVSVTAATVTSGIRGMRGIIAVGGATVGEAISAAACGTQAALDRARVPHLIEFLQIHAGGGRIVDVGDTVPAVGAHTVDDRPVVGDEIRGGALWRLRGHVADVGATGQAPPHGREAVRSEERRVG